MKLVPLILLVSWADFSLGFLVRNHPRTFTHLTENHGITPLFSKNYEIYKLRRQKEISDSLQSIFTRQRGLRIGANISPELIQGISVMEVRLNGDCSHADVFVLSSGDLFQQRQSFSWLNRNLKRIRYLMAQMLRFRKNVPTIQFIPFDLQEELDEIREDIEIDSTEDPSNLPRHNNEMTPNNPRNPNKATRPPSCDSGQQPPPSTFQNGLLLVQSE